MDWGTALITVALTTLALSYAWGMRGLVIGGEKGAMLPGAYLGLLLAWFSGSEVIRQNFWLFAAAGALSMFFGGSETYGQTLGFVLHPDRRLGSRMKGYIGVALKGALWFGLSGTALGMMFSAAAGMYKWYDIVIMTVLIPVAQLLGVRVFNYPFNKANGVFPTIYFSVDRREEWGGNLATVILLVTFVCMRSDDLALILGFAGAAGGALGWAIALKLYDLCSKPLKNGRYILGSLSEKGYVDGWKIMEFVLGAFGGFVISLFYCLKFDRVAVRIDRIETAGIWSPAVGFEPWISVAAFAVLMLSVLQYAAAYAKKRDVEGDFFEDSHTLDLIERPLYYLLPLMAVLLGSVNTGKLISGFVIYWVAVEKTAFGGRLDGYKNKKCVRAILLASALLLLGVEIVSGGLSIAVTWLLYGLPYLAMEFVFAFSPEKRRLMRENGGGIKGLKAQLGSAVTVYPFFILQITVLYVCGLLLFMR